jgi:hypothetical protein
VASVACAAYSRTGAQIATALLQQIVENLIAQSAEGFLSPVLQQSICVSSATCNMPRYHLGLQSCNTLSSSRRENYTNQNEHVCSEKQATATEPHAPCSRSCRYGDWMM